MAMKLHLIYPSCVMLHLHRLDLSVYRPPHRHIRRKSASLGRPCYQSKRLWRCFHCIGRLLKWVAIKRPFWWYTDAAASHGHFFVVGQLIGHHRHHPHVPCFHTIFLDGIYRYHDLWDGFSRCIAISSPRWLFRHRAPGAIMGPTPPQCNLHRPKTITQQSTTYTEWLPPVGGGKGSIFDHGALIFIRFGG